MGSIFIARMYDNFLGSNKQMKSVGMRIDCGGSRLEGWFRDGTNEQEYKLTLEPVNREDYNGEEMGIMPTISKNRKEVGCGTKKNKKKRKGRDIKRTTGSVI